MLLSRACLGKMIISSIKSGEKGAAPLLGSFCRVIDPPDGSERLKRHAIDGTCANETVVLKFRPAFVPSLSWQSDHFQQKGGPKHGCRAPPGGAAAVVLGRSLTCVLLP
jgi:hypothetical protein